MLVTETSHICNSNGAKVPRIITEEDKEVRVMVDGGEGPERTDARISFPRAVQVWSRYTKDLTKKISISISL
jgi:hypothetical protein